MATPQLVVVVQCAKSMQRCSGYNCMRQFYAREGKFAPYAPDARYLMFDCGGCCGKGLTAKMENLCRKLAKFGEYVKQDVRVHLASCIVSDNHHMPPCPFKNYIQDIIERRGFSVVLGSYISKKTEEKRQTGQYKSFE